LAKEGIKGRSSERKNAGTTVNLGIIGPAPGRQISKEENLLPGLQTICNIFF
jgi:hypothetical protein